MKRGRDLYRKTRRALRLRFLPCGSALGISEWFRGEWTNGLTPAQEAELLEANIRFLQSIQRPAPAELHIRFTDATPQPRRALFIDERGVRYVEEI